MSTDRARGALQLFEQILDVEPSQRGAWLVSACEGDEALAAAVRSLLAAHSDVGDFLEVSDTAAKSPGTAKPLDIKPGVAIERVHPGACLGDFLIEEQIGAGGMGVVYRAHQLSLHRDVALKVLSPNVHHSKSARTRFQREVRAVARLRHPNIVSVYTTGEEGGTLYYAMELVTGPPLSDVIRHQRRSPIEAFKSVDRSLPESHFGSQSVPETETVTAPDSAELGLLEIRGMDGDYFAGVARWLADVAEGLGYAHRSQVVHRDIKPSNLLISEAGRLLISDFGLARILEEPGVTQTGECVGTPYYMAPEQIFSVEGGVDARTDVYSLGATLYELLTLRPPFPGQGRDEVLTKILRDRPVKPKRLNSDVPRDLETLCLRALEKDPTHRFQSANEMAADLRRFAEGNPIDSRPVGHLERSARWLDKHRGSAAILAAAVLLSVVAAFFAYRSYTTETRWTADQHRRLFENAQLAVLEGNLEQAESLIDEAERQGAPEKGLRVLRGHLMLSSGRYQDACDELEVAARLMPDSVAANALLARAYSSNAEHDRSASVLRRLTSLEPDTVEDYLFLGQAQSRQDIDLAIETLNEAVERDRTSVVARLVRGNAYVTRAEETAAPSDAEDAISDLRIATELLDANALLISRQLEAHLAAATAYSVERVPLRKQQHLDLAASASEKLADFPDHYLAHRWRAFYWDYVGDDQRAIDEWRKMQHLRIAFLVLTLYRQAEFDEALRLCDERLKKYPVARFTDFFRGFTLAAMTGDPRDVLEAFEIEGEERLDTLTASEMNYVLRCLAGDLSGAHAVCKQLRIADTQPPRSAWEVERLNFTCGDLTPAALLATAGASRSRSCLAHFLVGVTHLAGGDRETAVEHFEQSAGFRTFEMLEDHMSRGLAAQLRRDPSWPSWIR